MKTLYLDCGMGAAGDMLTAALLELHPEPEAFVERLNVLGLPGVHYQAVPAVRCGIRGTRMIVTVDGMEENEASEQGTACAHGHGREETLLRDGTHAQQHGGGAGCGAEGHVHHHGHSHSGMEDIRRRTAGIDVPEKVRADVLAVYELIAQAESAVHGVPVEQIHFHEVGERDAVADVTAVCLLMYELAPERVAASPVHVGGGTVRCAHGVLPVPAPATALLLKGIPSVGGPVESELCTPTGAALLRYFVKEYGPQPSMSVDRIGYGCGQKEFDRGNFVRAVLGASYEETGPADPAHAGLRAGHADPRIEGAGNAGETCGSRTESEGGTDHALISLECNLDDMTPEAVAFAMEELLSAGAMDVYTTAIGMKKSRPGVLLTCICSEGQRENMVRLMFRHTTTLGIRETGHPRRYALERRIETLETPYGPVRVKRSSGWGSGNVKAEYEDLASIARRTGRPLKEISREISEIAARQ